MVSLGTISFDVLQFSSLEQLEPVDEFVVELRTVADLKDRIQKLQ